MTVKIDWQRLIPRYWLQNTHTDWTWDALLNQLMDEHEPVEEYAVAIFGGVEVWVRNYPYAYGSPYNVAGLGGDPLPSVATRKRLRAILRAIERARYDSAMAALAARVNGTPKEQA